MNYKLLTKLLEESGFNVEKLSQPYPGGFPREDMLCLESLVESVVLECVGIANEYDGVGSTIVDRFKEHFGVEE